MKVDDLIESDEFKNQELTLDHLYRVQRARSYEFWLFRRNMMHKYLDYDVVTPLRAVENVSSSDLRRSPEWSHFWQQNSRIPQSVLDRYTWLLDRMVQAKLKYEEAGGTDLESRWVQQ